MIKNIFFDLDGTLIDPYQSITTSIQYALTKMNITPPDELRWCIGPPLIESFKSLLENHPQKTAEEAIALYRERFVEKGIYENKLYQGIIDLLTSIQQAGHILYVVTAKPWEHAEKIIEHFGIHNFFKKVYGSELDGTRANKADLIQYVLRTEAIAPKDAIMIGDRKHDLIGAKANDVACIGVTWGYGALEELEAEKPNRICNKPSDLTDYLLRGERI
jgi:phosphoglycolate phosphatase